MAPSIGHSMTQAPQYMHSPGYMTIGCRPFSWEGTRRSHWQALAQLLQPMQRLSSKCRGRALQGTVLAVSSFPSIFLRVSDGSVVLFCLIVLFIVFHRLPDVVLIAAFVGLFDVAVVVQRNFTADRFAVFFVYGDEGAVFLRVFFWEVASLEMKRLGAGMAHSAGFQDHF